MARLLDPVVEYVHERFDVLESFLVVVHEVAHGLCRVLGRCLLILDLFQLQFFLPFFADALERASFVHLGLYSWRLALQLLKLRLPLAEVLHNGLKLFLKLLLELFGLRNWLNFFNCFLHVQFLQSRLLPSKW